MKFLVTGGSGFLGSALVSRLAGHYQKVIALSRHPLTKAIEGVVSVTGDILKPDLGVPTLADIDAVYHLAADHNLGPDKDGAVWRTNVKGTENVIEFCLSRNVPHLFFCSTAYTLGRNPYEKSKAICEVLVQASHIPQVTIFKPSIIMGSTIQHFSQFVILLIKMHKRAEVIRRLLEGTLRLPVIEPVFRLRGNSTGTLNLIQVDEVAKAMATIQGTGTFWLTHPCPATLDDITRWVGEFMLVRLTMAPDFKPMPVEAVFHRLASAFVPYLQGDDFKSDIKSVVPAITREFLHEELKRSFLSQGS